MKAHLAASYQTGDPAEDMVEVESVRCVDCNGWLDPVIGKVHQGTMMRWDIWVEGSYEHRTQPEHPHIPKGTP
jgi:hypothetical protein